MGNDVVRKQSNENSSVLQSKDVKRYRQPLGFIDKNLLLKSRITKKRNSFVKPYSTSPARREKESNQRSIIRGTNQDKSESESDSECKKSSLRIESKKISSSTESPCRINDKLSQQIFRDYNETDQLSIWTDESTDIMSIRRANNVSENFSRISQNEDECDSDFKTSEMILPCRIIDTPSQQIFRNYNETDQLKFWTSEITNMLSLGRANSISECPGNTFFSKPLAETTFNIRSENMPNTKILHWPNSESNPSQGCTISSSFQV